MGINDPPRHGVKEALRKTRESGVKVMMLTGDSKETAVAIATELGIYDRDSTALSYLDVENDSEGQLARKLENVSVFYRMAPSHKTKIIQALRLRGEVVAMTGYCLY